MLAPSSSNTGADIRLHANLTGVSAGRFSSEVYARRLDGRGRRRGARRAGRSGDHPGLRPALPDRVAGADLRAAHRAGDPGRRWRSDAGGAAAGTGGAAGVRGRRSRRDGARLGGRRGPLRTGRRWPWAGTRRVAVTDSMPALHLLPLAERPRARCRCWRTGVLRTAADDQGRRRDRRAAHRRRGDRPGARAGAASSCGRAAPRPRSPPTSPKPLSPRGIRRPRSSSSAPVPTAPIRTTSARTGSCRPATSSSSTSAARLSPATTPTAPAPTASASRPREIAEQYAVLQRAQAGRGGRGPPRGDCRAGRRRRPRRAGRRRAWRSTSCTAPATASGCRCTRSPTSSPATSLPLARGHGVQRRAGDLPTGPVGRPHRGHRDRHRRRGTVGEHATARADGGSAVAGARSGRGRAASMTRAPARRAPRSPPASGSRSGVR